MMLQPILSLPTPVVDPLFPRLPELDSRAVRLPDMEELAVWRRQANLRMEASLSRFDAALIECQDIEHAARRAIEEVKSWVRASISPFSTAPGRELVHGHVRQCCAAAWSERDEQVVQRAPEDPDGVDRHLRLFLGLAYESAARGYASLIAL